MASPGRDPWMNSDGGSLALVYPGERFGIKGPIPSIRLKVQRNAAQDIALLKDRDRVEVARRFNGTTPDEWWTPRPPIANGQPQEWTNSDIDDAPSPNRRKFERVDIDAWQRVHDYVMEVAR